MKKKDKTEDDELYVVAYQDGDEMEIHAGSKRQLKEYLERNRIRNNEVYWIKGHVTQRPSYGLLEERRN